MLTERNLHKAHNGAFRRGNDLAQKDAGLHSINDIADLHAGEAKTDASEPKQHVLYLTRYAH